MGVQAPLLIFSVRSCCCRCYVFGGVVVSVGFGFKLDWLLQLCFGCALGWLLVIFLLLIVSLGNSQRAPSSAASSVATQGLVCCCNSGLIFINDCSNPAVVDRGASMGLFGSDTLFFSDL